MGCSALAELAGNVRVVLKINDIPGKDCSCQLIMY